MEIIKNNSNHPVPISPRFCGYHRFFLEVSEVVLASDAVLCPAKICDLEGISAGSAGIEIGDDYTLGSRLPSQDLKNPQLMICKQPSDKPTGNFWVFRTQSWANAVRKRS